MLGQNDADGWRLRGTARQVALFVAASFVIFALVVAVIEHVRGPGWGWPLLQQWSLVPHSLAVGGLLYIGIVHRSRAFLTLGALLGLALVEEAFHPLNSAARVQVRAAVKLSRWTGIEWDAMSRIVLYGFVGVVTVAFLVLAYWQASRAARRVVRNVALLLVVAGLFGGPIYVLAGTGDSLQWMFVEELGEAVAYALIAGYVAGLGCLAAMPRPRRKSRTPLREGP